MMELEYIEHFYNPEFIRPLILCFKLFNGCDINFYNSPQSKFEKFWKNIIVVPSVIFYYTTLTAYIINVISETKDVVDLAKSAPIYIITTQAVVRVVITNLKKPEIHKIVDDLGSMWRTTDLTEIQIKKKNAMLRKIDVCQRVFYATVFCGTCLFTFGSLAETLLRRFIFQQDSELLLPYHCYYPFDPTKTYFRYIMLYIIQSYSMYKCILVVISGEFLMHVLCLHLVTQFMLLNEDLRNLRPSKQRKNNLEIEEDNGMDIKDIIKRHQKLIILSKNLDSIFTIINLLALFFATIITCFFAFAAVVSHSGVFMFVYYIAVLCMMVPLFMVCYFSELLATESARIAEAAYENLWYEGGRKYQKSICFIIVRSQRACCLTLLKYAPINLTTFRKVLSTTWSYFTLIYGMYGDVQ